MFSDTNRNLETYLEIFKNFKFIFSSFLVLFLHNIFGFVLFFKISSPSFINSLISLYFYLLISLVFQHFINNILYLYISRFVTYVSNSMSR
ncbi:unnamed protein product [Brugia timori]|uniref:7TM_GPCR_Srx domain-containing protein n=1 Tax=Brugia timori TaxID=42155 RepID=A0A0R3QM75_9BILA|nr:unnamed protein product [Brugia timori]